MTLRETFSTLDNNMPSQLSLENSCDDLELVRLLKPIGYKGTRRREGALAKSEGNDSARVRTYIVEGRNLLDLSITTCILARYAL